MKKNTKLILILFVATALCTTILTYAPSAKAYSLQSFTITPDPSKITLVAPGTYNFTLTATLPGGSGSNPVNVYLLPTAGEIQENSGITINYDSNPMIIPAGKSSCNTTMTLILDSSAKSGDQSLGVSAYDNPGAGGTIIGSFTTTLRINEFQLIINSINGYGNPYGEGWYVQDTPATFGVTQTSVQISGAQYDFNGWSTNDTTNGYEGTDSSHTIIMTADVIETANWAINLNQVNFQQNGSDVNPTVSYQYLAGGLQHQGTAKVPFSILVDPESTISYSYESVVSGSSGTRYVFTSTSPVSPQTINSELDIVGYYKTQHLLTVDTNFGTVFGSDWYDAGSNVSISAISPSADSGEKYVWVGWIGTGSGSYNGPDNPTSFTDIQINGPITEVATWNHQYELEVISVYGNTSGSGWYDSGSTAYATLSFESALSGASTQYIFGGWADDASGSSLTSNAITMNGPKTASASWETQYRVFFDQSGSDLAPAVTYKINNALVESNVIPFSIWVTSGSTISYNYDSSLSNTEGIQCILTSLTPASQQTVDSPLNIVGNYETYYWVSYVTDVPVTVPSGEWVLSGHSGSGVFTSSQLNDSGDIQYVYLDDNRSATITQPSTVTAKYKTQYYLTVQSAYGNPSGQDWYDAGTSAYAVIDNSVVYNAGIMHTFVTWAGDASGYSLMSRPIIMDSPKTATASWVVSSSSYSPTPSPAPIPFHTSIPTPTQSAHPTTTPSQSPEATIIPIPSPQPTPLFTVAGAALLIFILLLITLLLLAMRRRKNNKNNKEQGNLQK